MLRRLIDDLRARPPGERGEGEMAALLAGSAEGWQAPLALPTRRGDYTRTCAYRDGLFEVLLLNWAPGAASEVHDHGDQDCWMYVLEGALCVDDYVRLDRADVPGTARVARRGRRTMGAGELDLRSGRFDLHRVAATCGAPAVSLHVYSGPLRSFLVYDEYSQRCETAVGRFDEALYAFTDAQLR